MENTELCVVHCGWDNGDNRFSLIKTKGKERESMLCMPYLQEGNFFLWNLQLFHDSLSLKIWIRN